MLIRSEILRLKSLHTAKGRKSANTVLIEGLRLVEDCLLSQWPIKSLFITEDNMSRSKYIRAVSMAKSVAIKHVLVSKNDMERISDTKNPQGIAMEIYIPLKNKNVSLENKVLYLDKISDPGNLGTIIRLCDWFGLSQILCSNETVDCYNPKVIQASMGSIVRVRCHYLNNLGDSLKSLKKPIFGASLNGKSIYKYRLVKKATYIFGSESHGISKDILKNLNCELTIPHFRTGKFKPDSLNVANSVAIFLSELSKT